MNELHVAPPTRTAGCPSTLREAVVQTVHPDATLDLISVDGRSRFVSVGYPDWYLPANNDHVYIADLQGDPQKVVVIAPINGRVIATEPVYTLATRPAAAAMPNRIIVVSDGGAGARFQGSDGTTWLNLG